MATDYFVGMDYGDYKNTLKFSSKFGVSSFSGTGTIKDKNIGIKFGIDNIANGRAYISYGDKVNSTVQNVDLKYTSAALNYDYYIGKYDSFTPYIGASLGYAKLTRTDEDSLGSASGSGMEYGVKIGSLVSITDNANFEIGYGYAKSNAEATSNYALGDIVIFGADTIKGFYVGFNDKF